MTHGRASSSLARVVKRKGAPHDAQMLRGTVDDARLLDAIRTLDGSGGNSDTAQRLCNALGFFVELLQQLTDTSGALDTPASARAALETLWEARVLTCLQRFVARRKHVDPAFVASCACSRRGCVRTLVVYTLVAIAYYLTREPRMASAVARTEFHTLAFDVLASEDDMTTLLLVLPRASPERKALLHRGARCVEALQQLAQAATPESGSLGTEDHNVGAPAAPKRVDRIGVERFQALPLQPHVLARMAQSALSLLVSDDEVRTIVPTHPVLVDSHELQQLSVAPDRTKIKKTAMPKCKGCKKPSAAPMPSLSLADRLAAASAETKRELAEHPLPSPLARERVLQQALRRQQVRAQCEYLEQLRRDLSQSLHVLHSGRAHADPQQSFAAWVESLPTIESKERERRESERLRAQHVLEMQFQREEARKRRLRECALMLENDCNALDETEQTKREQKRLEFLRMHEEMERLKVQEQQHETHAVAVRYTDDNSDADEHVSSIEAKMLQQQTLSAQRKLRQSKHDDEQRRMRWVRERRSEARELECMSREDRFYVEKLLRLKQLEQEQRKLLAKQGGGNPLEEQQRKIERMRQLDLERRAAEKETERMRTEDLLARQCRYLEAEREQLQKQRERRERKQMETEERECRARWTLVANEQRRLDELEAKRLRIEARKLRKWQQAYEQQVLAAWVESWDASGNVYFYNSLTGASQWESPFAVGQ